MENKIKSNSLLCLMFIIFPILLCQSEIEEFCERCYDKNVGYISYEPNYYPDPDFCISDYENAIDNFERSSNVCEKDVARAFEDAIECLNNEDKCVDKDRENCRGEINDLRAKNKECNRP
jgi:hypothetical protein